MNEFTLEGKEGLEYLVEMGGVGNIYSNLVSIESDILKLLKNYFQQLKLSGQYGEDVEMGSAWNKEKQRSHQLIVECSGKGLSNEGFHKNKSLFTLIDGTNQHDFEIRGGNHIIDCEISCFSLNRSAVAILADATITGLNLDLAKALGAININLQANSISISGKIQTVELVKGINTFKILIIVKGIVVGYKQVVELNGEILKNFNYYVEKLQMLNQ